MPGRGRPRSRWRRSRRSRHREVVRQERAGRREALERFLDEILQRDGSTESRDIVRLECSETRLRKDRRDQGTKTAAREVFMSERARHVWIEDRVVAIGFDDQSRAVRASGRGGIRPARARASPCGAASPSSARRRTMPPANGSSSASATAKVSPGSSRHAADASTSTATTSRTRWRSKRATSPLPQPASSSDSSPRNSCRSLSMQRTR